MLVNRIGVLSVVRILVKKRKRYTCNTYESHKLLSKTLRTMLHKYNKDKGISNNHATTKLSCFKCTRCNSKACISCVTTVCLELKINDDHSADNWLHAIQAGIRDNEQPVEFIGHYCEIRVQVEESISNYRNMTDPTINKSLRYDVHLHLHLPELNTLFAPSIIDHVDIHGFGEEPTSCLP